MSMEYHDLLSEIKEETVDNYEWLCDMWETGLNMGLPHDKKLELFKLAHAQAVATNVAVFNAKD